MSKFNKGAIRPAVSSPVKTDASPTGVTHEGAPGYARETKSELFLLSVANMVGEGTFYETAADRDSRFQALVREVAVADMGWLAGFLPWLRNDANMRSASLVAAVEAVKARSEAGETGGSRQLIDAVLQRADEPGEALAYWLTRFGRPIPIAVKRGIADAVVRLWSEYSLMKYDTRERPLRFGDVVDLTQPAYHHREVRGTWRYDLYGHALDRRHNRDKPIPESLTTLRARAELFALPVDERRAILDRDDAADALRSAGVTWEALAGWLEQPMDARAWEVMIPSMGFMALLRNLRNFDEAGVSDEVAEQVAKRLSDPEQVARSRQFPFRFLAAYNAAPSLRWGHALEKALNASLSNVPALSGRTLILVDRSGSMFGPISNRSGLNRADTAALFGSALAVRADSADLVEFGTNHKPVSFSRADPILRILGRFGSLGGTNTAEAVRGNFRRHDRVVIVTDEQAWGGFYGADPLAQVPVDVPVYTWNLAGYRYGHGPSGEGRRHTFGGLTDQAFRMIPLLEAGRDGAWPWMGDDNAS